jgi:CRP-like cAMP-binding protein
MDVQSDQEMLARTELFRGAPAEAIDRAASMLFRKHVAAGGAVLRQGDPVTFVYLLVIGRLRAAETTPDGQQIIIRYIGPGEIAGEAALSGGTEVYPSAVTAVDDSELVGWNVAAVREIMARYPAVALNAVELLGARYRDIQIRLRELSTEKVERRIAHTILRLAGQAGRRTARGIEISFPLSRQDLAEMCGTTLHTVSRTLSAWEERGIVDCGRRRVIVAKAALLGTIAEEESG